jgi:hypothetical protein
MKARASGLWTDSVGGRVQVRCRSCSSPIPAGVPRTVEVAFATPTHSFKRFHHTTCLRPPAPVSKSATEAKTLAHRVSTIRKSKRDHVSTRTLAQLQKRMQQFVRHVALETGPQ